MECSLNIEVQLKFVNIFSTGLLNILRDNPTLENFSLQNYTFQIVDALDKAGKDQETILNYMSIVPNIIFRLQVDSTYLPFRVYITEDLPFFYDISDAESIEELNDIFFNGHFEKNEKKNTSHNKIAFVKKENASPSILNISIQTIKDTINNLTINTDDDLLDIFNDDDLKKSINIKCELTEKQQIAFAELLGKALKVKSEKGSFTLDEVFNFLKEGLIKQLNDEDLVTTYLSLAPSILAQIYISPIKEVKENIRGNINLFEIAE